MDIFVSVGSGLNSQQEEFVSAVETKLRVLNFVPHTIGRNTFSVDAPLRAVTELMDRCAGVVVIALERYSFDNGLERRGSSKEKTLSSIKLPTSWNQIEAAMAYGHGIPLLVIVQDGLHCDGLLEKGYDWFVQEMPLDVNALNSPAFAGVMENWRDRVCNREPPSIKPPSGSNIDPGSMSIGDLLRALKPGQAWGVVLGLATIIGGAFTLGAKLFATGLKATGKAG